MEGTGIFITDEEKEAVQVAFDCSGMFLSGGMRMGDPEFEVARLCEKYNLDKEKHALNLKTKEFLKV